VRDTEMLEYSIVEALLAAEEILSERKKSKIEKNPEYYTGLSKSTASKRAAQFSKQSKKSDSDPSAYKPAPGDSAETKPSKWNKKFKDMFGEEEVDEFAPSSSGSCDLCIDNPDEEEVQNIVSELLIIASSLLEEGESESLNEALSAKIRKSLKKKAEKSNAPMGALTTVYNKGLAAWKTGHRPGANQHAWAMARVNSFLAGGPARRVDAAQWEKVKKHRKKKRG
jgi:DNA-binding protein YbaB